MTRAIVLTSTSLRHQYVVNYLAERLDVVGVWQEEKSFVPEYYAETSEDLNLIRRHFVDRDESERKYFGEHARLRLGPGTVHRKIDPGTINDPAVLEAMTRLGPEVVLVFGTCILRRPILEAFEGRFINLHLGLSPYYRGSGTNFWPLVNREPEYVGATIHFLDSEIDTGPVIAHVRPPIEKSDGPHDIGNRAIREGAVMLARVASAHARGGVRSQPQVERGRLYQRKHFSAYAVRQLYRNFETEMILEYLADKVARDAKLDLVVLEVAS